MRSEVLPKEDAPDSAALVRDFVNTTDFQSGEDDLDTPAALARHLRDAGLCPASARATTEDLLLAHALRSGLRAALERHHDGTTVVAASLSATLRRLPLRLEWDASGPQLQPAAGGVLGALTRIGIAARACVEEGAWRRLKICASDQCGWAYYDHSKNRSRSWCEYGCGNRIKVRAYRERRRAE